MIKATYVTRYTNSQLQIRFQGGLPLRLFGGLFLLGEATFSITCWLLALTRKYTVIDPVGREVLDVKDFLLYKQAKRYPVEAFNQVTVSNEIRRVQECEHQYETYPVYKAYEATFVITELQ